ncbi:cyclin-dependent kinase F-4-like [Magnolia sinica]|uniref:cyclin-dependent kinase F-4-like n=1 Tax=Magnolia sinica TaxID=86752 RepID=UPI00265994A9|nr:cyclin-dependent kinase F-4-like [Magnolia sinica]
MLQSFSEADEIYKICNVIGSPSQDSWAEGLQLANAIKYQFPECASVQLSVLIPSASKEAINLVSDFNQFCLNLGLQALQPFDATRATSRPYRGFVFIYLFIRDHF